jgi:dTDP-4-amino-4,6-dideoxygalactose transaminase
MKTIPFNLPCYTEAEDKYVIDAMRSSKLSGDGHYGQKCQTWFEKKFECPRALLTPSCTHALEMAAILLNIVSGDEVIMSSYTFVSTANAFVLRGAKIVFVDIRPDTMNINEELIEEAISSRTKAIVVVHYAGVSCEMDLVMDIAVRHGLFVIEDAAQGLMSTYNHRQLGTFGHMAAFSFHETKNLTSGGEGGVLVINDEQFVHRAEIIREKGTNRSQFFRGMADKYTWVDVGSSYLPSEIQSAYLWGQLEQADLITSSRVSIWNSYNEKLLDLARNGFIEVPFIPDNCIHNGHMYYIKCKDIVERTSLLAHLKEDGIFAVFHYVPLHSSPAGSMFGCFIGEDHFTTSESDRLIRLPMWYGLTSDETQRIADSINTFYST